MLYARKLITTMVLLNVVASPMAEPNTTPSKTRLETDLNDLTTLYVGTFDAETHIGNSNKGSVEARNEAKFDRMKHVRLQIKSPDLPGIWIYAQANKEGQDAAYRQSILEFYLDEDDTISTRVWRFKKQGMKAQGMPETALLNQLSPEQLERGLPDTCNMIWHRRGAQFEGTVDHKQCIIQSKYKDEKRRLFAEEIVFEDGMWSREGAYQMNGELAFGLEQHQFYKYQRSQ